MKGLLSGGVAVLLAVTLVWFAVGGPPSGDEGAAATPAAPAAPAAAEGEDGTDDRSERGRTASAAQGPPPWAQGHQAARGKGSGKAWHAEWRAMSPKQRESLMTRLAQEHATDMRAWARCNADGREGCEKPLPPGLAKQQLGR